MAERTPERITRRDVIRSLLPLGGAAALSGCVAVFSRQEQEEVAGISSPAPSETPRPSLTPESCEKHPLVELFERLGLTYDGIYFSDQEGNKFVFEGFERQEAVEGICPERIVIELKGEPCETATPTKTATRRISSPTATRERRDTPVPPTNTPEPPTDTPVPPTEAPTATIPPTMTAQPPEATITPGGS
ncbi:MAG: hypothetical protein ACOYT7_03040 [Patescibacteria group bacterium]